MKDMLLAARELKRLQAQLLEYFPALERDFDYSRSKAALMLLGKYRTPDGIRPSGEARIHAWLKKHGVSSSAAVAGAGEPQNPSTPSFRPSTWGRGSLPHPPGKSLP